MVTKRLLTGVLVVVCAGLVITQVIADNGYDLDSAGPKLISPQPAYLTVEVPNNQWITVTNPRTNLGQVFYVTDIYSNINITMRLPVEIAPIATNFIPDRYNTPMPLQTTMEVLNQGAPTTVVLAGYYARRLPVIEALVVD